MEYPNGRVIQNVKAISRAGFFATARAYADLFLSEQLRYDTHDTLKVTSIDTRSGRAQMWLPKLHHSDGMAMTSTDTYTIATDVMATLAWNYDWAQVMLRFDDGSAPLILTWHASEWHVGDVPA